ncbi:hypothetical protein llap_5609 [Limosa lapponica baueri]|uniref:Uncharacterized protein n=1 Tax=Limosa lapponica baueri TaxID=1758121 RepID=A0A2I0UDG5_LIMLA|nr:hypothetical protein llap_5609 [Limosa lapponica baueri]
MAKLPAPSTEPGFHPYLVDQNNYFTVQKDQTAMPAKNFVVQPATVSLNCTYLCNYSFFSLPRHEKKRKKRRKKKRRKKKRRKKKRRKKKRRKKKRRKKKRRSWHDSTEQQCTAVLGAVRVMATPLFLLSLFCDDHLQLGGEKKAMFKLVQQPSRAELRRLDAEVHEDGSVYGFSLCHTWLKSHCLTDPHQHHGSFSAATALDHPDRQLTRKRVFLPFYCSNDRVTCANYHSEGTVHIVARTSKEKEMHGHYGEGNQGSVM